MTGHARPLHIAVIGCGVIGPLHVDCYRRVNGVSVTMVCDKISRRAEELAQKYDIPAWTDSVEKVLADHDIDAVSICVDHCEHADIAVAAFEAGKHVLCEKPLASTETGLQMMGRAVAKHPELVLGGVLQHRFDPLFIAIKELLNSGSLGRLISMDFSHCCRRIPTYYTETPWRGKWETEGGSALINQAIHYYDILLWLSGGASSVAAEWSNLDHQNIIETEDALAATLTLRSGALASFVTTTAAYPGWAWALGLTGTKGLIRVGDDQLREIQLESGQTEAKAKIDAALAVKQVPPGKVYYGAGHPAQIANFVAAIRGEEELRVTFRSAADTVRAVLAAYESGRTGSRVVLGLS